MCKNKIQKMKALFFFSLLLPLLISFKIFSPSTVLLLLPLFLGLHLVNVQWLKPQILRKKLERQGIKGPPPSFLYGNAQQMQKIQAAAAVSMKAANSGEFIAHDYTSSLFPYFEQWRKEYGNVYTYSSGNKQHLYVNNPEMVKEMNQSLTMEIGKPTYITKRIAPMLGNGILRSNGHIWTQQRKIVAPEFFMNKVKGMVGLMLQSAEPVMTKWDASIEAQGGTIADIRVDEDLRGISADVIARACFGSSYFKGENIFSKLRTLQILIAQKCYLFGIPTLGFLRSKQQKELEKLEKEIESLIWETVRERKEECLDSPASEKDLLQQFLEGATNVVGKDSSKKFIVDNCKNIYFAGHETTANAASWCLMLLSLHPEWQDRIRQEIADVCPNGLLDGESLSKMKTVTMVIHETLRLYPPGAFVSREAFEDTKIGEIMVPKGVCIWSLIPTLHRDTDIWGEDANEFKPERFANGLLGACKVPQAYIPFGLGPRVCVGRNFALVEVKLLISLIVSKFSFSLSLKYKHSPAYHMTVEPGQGLQLLIQRA